MRFFGSDEREDGTSETVLFPELFRTKDAAELLGVPKHTLVKWRSSPDGPQYYRLGLYHSSPVVYSKNDLLTWLEIRHYKSFAHEKREKLKKEREEA